MKKLLLSLLVSLAALSLLSGCSSKAERLGVQVHVSKLERKTDGSFLATLLFSNPNVGFINISESTHQLTLNGKPAGTLKVSEPIGLPPQQTATATATLAPTGGAKEIAGSLSYELDSLLILRVLDDDTARYRTFASGTVLVQ